jgi:hypothetical protein
MEFLPTVIHAEYCGDFRICVAFNDGVENTIDFSDWLAGPVFEPLKDPGHFQRFFMQFAGLKSHEACLQESLAERIAPQSSATPPSRVSRCGMAGGHLPPAIVHCPQPRW